MENYDSQTPPNPQPIHHSFQEETAPVMRFSDWIVTLLIMMVPVLNAIMLIIWSTDRFTNPNKANWAKATLVLIAIQVVLMMFFIGTIIGSLSHLMSNFNTSGLW